MRRGEHLPLLTVRGLEFWIECACGLRFSLGDTYDDTPGVKLVTRRIRTMANAQTAHLLHHTSSEAASYCEHTAAVDQGRLVCAECGDPL